MSLSSHAARPTCIEAHGSTCHGEAYQAVPWQCTDWRHASSSSGSAWARRRKDEGEDEEGMEDWDLDKLEEVIAQKHSTEKNRPTDIICKFFLDAVEKKVYGWCGLCPSCWPPHWLMCSPWSRSQPVWLLHLLPGAFNKAGA